ncbi:tRNA (adenosine(37)-N6)-threonylcarbamoyltransferase complex dimerization subunit type 1 TsaB [Jeotgalicoccus sp. ATCC 8456]|uniref:tRNA (adenosine(37)-N6)-threonylcarbamoyltransferase complex dimerization subunit type 1 TsaB n=1 Tax=Jeotgalicoccus sp. ATCC 8456 TaxID=946435 RepID=UPI0018E621B5|nr:tRNA (adenosine(37)-N6)-threonylcarbamoyltransferase complex dimerization subunit type 1 TsaB [Jeotgalicoccus sp. ATCC 8456]QQD84898.1 tRNA (adenosine(37)-N6)-threonylcarbamoyltransferase complex dimerization subunit type 1 TsaB [Jeotgalicoccus sp. ATCC 8456]
MISLLIDTSNQALSVALNRDGKLVAEINTNFKKTHSETLLENINKLLNIGDIKKQDIDRVIVARGPGSYTGIRIAATVAKMLAKGLNIPLYSVSSLFVLAASERIEGPVTALIDARRESVFTATYDFKKSEVKIVNEPEYKTFIDDKASTYFLNGDEKRSIHISEFVDVGPRIACVEQYNNMLREEDVDAFTPDYLRISEAERNWQDNQQ